MGAKDNTSNYNVYSTDTELGPGTAMFTSSMAVNGVDGQSEWYRYDGGSEPVVFQLGPTGLVNGVTLVSELTPPLNPDPDPDPTGHWISPTTVNMAASGGTFNIQVRPDGNVAWDASIELFSAPFASIQGANIGYGDGQISVQVNPNMFNQALLIRVFVNIGSEELICIINQAGV